MDADLVEQFVDATGSSMAEAMRYLKLCDNDINAAVGCYFDPEVVSSMTRYRDCNLPLPFLQTPLSNSPLKGPVFKNCVSLNNVVL